MTLFKRLSAVLSGLLVASALGCAATSTRESTGGYIDDAAITTKVKTAIFNEPSLTSMEISVETFKGVVQLSGFVSSANAISKAADVARRVDGVVSVKNDMRLR